MLRRKQWQDRGQRVERKRLAGREAQVLSGQLEVVSHGMIADHRLVALNDLDSQVVQCEFVGCRHVVGWLGIRRASEPTRGTGSVALHGPTVPDAGAALRR